MPEFNPGHLRQLRQAKVKAAHISAPRAPQTPFIEPRELTDGTHYFRVWTPHDTKNPIGYLRYRTHEIWQKLGPDGRTMTDPFSFVCPRSTNWDPLPMRYNPVLGLTGEPLYEQELDQFGSPVIENGAPKMVMLTTPEYKERCWACETEEQLVEEGIESGEQVGDMALRNWLFGTPYAEGTLSQNGLLSAGSDKYHFPVTFRAKVASSIPKPGGKGEKFTYCPANELLHADLSLNPGKILDRLLSLLEEVPDCTHPIFGRWFKLDKSAGGKGVGGYSLSIEPNVSAAGFEIEGLNYPNYASWGKGNAKYNKPGKRFSYTQVETIGGDPTAWWVPKLEQLGVVCRDDSPAYDPTAEKVSW
jgi:hypothetical protein